MVAIAELCIFSLFVGQAPPPTYLITPSPILSTSTTAIISLFFSHSPIIGVSTVVVVVAPL